MTSIHARSARWIAALTLGLFGAVAAAEGPAPTAAEAVTVVAKGKSKVFAEGLLIATLRREGALLDLWGRYRKPLYDSDDEAFRDNYVGAGVISQTSPIFSQNGVYAELAPATFFRLTAAYELVSYFGVLDSMRPLTACEGVSRLAPDDPRCDFGSPPASSDVGNRGDWGHRVWAEAMLQGRLGPVVAFNALTVERWWFRKDWSHGSEIDHWFNELYALPQTRDDTVITNSGQLMYEVLPDRGGSNPNVMVGASDDLAYSMGTRYLTHRVGLVAVCRLPVFHGVRDLAAALIVQPYTQDRYMAGGLPFMGLFFSGATGNLL